MGNSASSQGSSTGTHDGDVGSSISEEQHDWPIEQAADAPEIQSLQEMRKPYINLMHAMLRPRRLCIYSLGFHGAFRNALTNLTVQFTLRRN